MKPLLLVGIATLLLAGSAMGVCNVPSPRLVCAEYFSSRVVVEATVVKIRSVLAQNAPDDIQAHVYTLRVNRLVRGDITEVFQVYEGNDSGSATFDWKTGRKYLLFLFYSTAIKLWALDGCGNSGPSDTAKSVLAQIDAIQKQNGDGVIHGVVSDQTLAAPFPGVRVEARGAKGLYKATTNSKGEFEIKVPAGRYTIHATKTGRSFYTADFSYENPGHLQVESGGCVQVQLVAR
jgi:hypothetical protein